MNYVSKAVTIICLFYSIDATRRVEIIFNNIKTLSHGWLLWFAVSRGNFVQHYGLKQNFLYCPHLPQGLQSLTS